MIKLITLNNGNTELISNMNHFIDIIDENLGYQARNYLSNNIEKLEYEADYTQTKINTDITAYEMNLEENTSCFIEILEIVEELKTITNSKRVNKKKLNELLDSIDRIINSQI